MNIWSRLGISVALLALFCIAASEILQPTLFYELHKWGVCASFIVTGLLTFLSGRHLNARIKARYLRSQALSEDRDADHAAWEPFLLFNLAYWGVMITLFGCIIVFFVPTHTKRVKARAAAPSTNAPRRKVEAAPVAPPTNATLATNLPIQVPHFQLQGLVLREPHPSALINGRTYFIGDVVQEAKVEVIRTNSVILDWRGIKVHLRPPL